jgi:hypothetical protein
MVALTERLIKHLRGQHDAVAEQTEHIVYELSYAARAVSAFTNQCQRLQRIG